MDGLILKRLHRAVRRHGVSGTLQLVPVNAVHLLRKASSACRKRMCNDRHFDETYGTVTAGFYEIYASTLSDSATEYACAYDATSPEAFARFVDSLPINAADYAFVDFGCGTGRAVILAAMRPFAEVTGIEPLPEFHRVAEANLGTFTLHRRCRKLRLLCQDARRYKPAARPHVFFLNNPFGEEVLRPVMDNIAAGCGAHLADSYVVYLNPKARHLFDKSPRWSTVADSDEAVIYRGT